MKLMETAAGESTRNHNHFLGVEHLFLALAADETSGIGPALSDQRVELDQVRQTLKQDIPRLENPLWGNDLIYTPRCHEVLQLAGRIASSHGSPAVEPHHMLEAMFREGRGLPLQVLRRLGVDLTRLQASLSHPPETRESPTPLLDQFGRDLTQLARKKALAPVVGRAREIDLLQQILLRKNKNNPVLVGDAGVGKTAVVEGFAQRLFAADCPEPFRDTRVVELSLAAVVAGTKYRGEFEERILGLLNEATSDPRIVLFLDEIHTLVGVGSSTTDSLDASNILKPALARGELRVVGATTVAEYRRTIERDAALDRRFDQILVEEPNRDESLEILGGVCPSLEQHHQVKIDPEALEAAVDLTIRYLPERRLPDKAIDALDQTCARRRLQAFRQRAERGEGAAPDGPPLIRGAEVTRTVSQWTGIPFERLSGAEARHILNLESELKKRVIGQDDAVRTVSQAVLTARAGLSSPQRPIGVFLFLGPTGVGKTELAKGVAAVLFGDEKRLIRFDMSEYSEPHAVAKLIGAPPGYVGYEEEGRLIAAVRTQPHSVVLFDEIEKAHPQLFDLFLQIFDEGRLSGSHGHSADFRHAVVILTSNIAVHRAPKPRMGFPTQYTGPDATSEAPPDLRQALTGHFRPELLNRIDDVLEFQPLGRDALRRIIDRYLREIESQLEARDVKLVLDDRVYDHLISLGESERFGARELRRVVDSELRRPLATRVLERAGAPHTISVTVDSGALRFSTEP